MTEAAQRGSAGRGRGRGGSGRSGPPTTKKSGAPPLPPPHVIEPTAAHAFSVVCCHPFCMSPEEYAADVLPRLAKAALDVSRVRFVFLQAPRRKISCYDGNPSERAWHDYLTDHGGDEGRPELEEEINGAHLATCRAQIHRAVDAEAAALAAAGGLRRVALMGESQGACVAADAAVTHRGPGAPAGVFCSYGQLYKPTPVATPSKKQAQLRFYAFHGAGDRCIAASLAMRSYAQLIDAGYRRVSIHVEPKLTHSQRSAAEDALLATALKDWGALDAPPPPPPERAPAPPAAERAPAAVAAATAVLAKPSADELVDGIARLDIERQASPES